MSSELGQRNRELAKQLQEKQRVMDQLSSINTELLDLNHKLETAQTQLLQADKMASIGQLAAGVAHEINNPVAFVHSNIGTLEMYLKQIFQIADAYIAQEQFLPAEVVRQLNELRDKLEYDYIVGDMADLMKESKDGLERVKKIVQELKDFSRVDQSEWDLLDITDGINSTLSLVRHELQSRADIVCELSALPPIECVLSQLNQVFMNLLINAAHAIKQHGTITIRTGMQGDDHVWVSIGDTGEGIPPENLSRIFDAFFTTKPVGKGTGLGLSLSYGIIKRHHGRIDVSSQMGSGTTFTITLPVQQPPANAAESDALKNAANQS
ncbi:MAG: ATPase [Burkholderiales bacterium]|nr:ATPase [Burkholderiales bacterium]